MPICYNYHARQRSYDVGCDLDVPQINDMTGYTARQQDASCLMNGTEGTSLFLMSGISNSSEVLRLRFFSLFYFKAKTFM